MLFKCSKTGSSMKAVRTTLAQFFLYGVMLTAVQGGHIPGDGGGDKQLNIGLLLPYSGWPVAPKMGSAIIVGINKVASEGILPGYTLSYTKRDTKCSAYDGLTAAMDLWSSSSDLDVFIGGGCSVVCEPLALVSAVWNLPHISWGCNSADLSDKHKYPTFTRTVGPWVSLAPMIGDLMNTFGWNRAGIIATTENIMQLTANAFRDELHRRGQDVFRADVKTVIVDSNPDAERLEILKGAVRTLKTDTRIIILIMGQRDVNHVLLTAKEENMINGEYVFISIDADLDASAEGPNNQAALTEGYQGFISCNVRKPSGSEWNTFAQAVVDELSNFDNTFPAITADQVDVHAGMLHDAVLMWAHGVKKTMNSLGESQLDNGTAITLNLLEFSFEGISGTVVTDKNGDRKPDYSIQIMQNGTYVTLLDYFSHDENLTKIYKPDKPGDWSGIMWASYRSSVPKGEPECGWDNEHCSKRTVYIVVAMVCLVVLAVAVAGLIYMKRKIAYEREVYNEELWKISWNEVQQNQIVSQIASQRAALHAQKTLRSLGKGQDTLSRTIVGRYKGANVTVKQLNRSSVDTSHYGRKLFLEIKHIRDMKHENINPFLGACTEAPHVCLLTAYCSKGSLQEVLHNEAFVLAIDFRISIANDIAKGMHYLHKSPLKSHGSLTSNNVVIDGRWVAKITDYGLSVFKEGIPKKPENLLWTAPELLRKGTDVPVYGTQPGDVYSFGIILSEIVTRDLPFAKNDTHHDTADIIERVKNARGPNCRPFIPPETCSHYWTRLMSSCWTEVVTERPSFKTIKLRVKEINGGREINVMDNMLNMLEQHSEQLEEVLEEKSSKLESERQKCEVLLLTRLPRDIMVRIEEEDVPEAETFHSVTILQTGIHHFSKMVAKFPPSEICYLLSTLWWKMDSLCSLYNVFKTDTALSDGEVVLGRLSEKDEKENAEIIATIALKMLCDIQSIHVPVLEGKLLPWKAAIHSGRCVGIVIGQRVPRYSIFGDAIGSTAKLVKHSSGLKILVSDKTRHLLLENESFQFQGNEHHDKKATEVTASYWLLKRPHEDEERLPDPSKCATF